MKPAINRYSSYDFHAILTTSKLVQHAEMLVFVRLFRAI